MIADGLALRHSRRSDGSLALQTNRARVLDELDLSLDRLVVGEQVHGARVREVGEGHAGRGARDPADALRATDGLVTREPAVALMVLGADCPLVCLFDPAGPAVAVVHAGWRGLAAGVLEEAIRVLAPENRDAVQAYLAPCAGPCCYEVGDEVAELFPGAAHVPPEGGRPHLDLPAAVTACLGTRVERLDRACTVCDAGYFSHREDGTAARQALLAALTDRIP